MCLVFDCREFFRVECVTLGLGSTRFETGCGDLPRLVGLREAPL